MTHKIKYIIIDEPKANEVAVQNIKINKIKAIRINPKIQPGHIFSSHLFPFSPKTRFNKFLSVFVGLYELFARFKFSGICEKNYF